ncbi:MAG: trp RNA-binding attenuation protein MtrB [Firmicutes bacterium]|nr:trp RNA-binding attenuation protein MtrB [Bacillota bacterium]
MEVGKVNPVVTSNISGDYIIVKALENGVTIMGLTRGKDTRFHHTEKLDRGELMVAQFTEHTSAIKIRGKAMVYTRFGNIDTLEEKP